MKNKSNSNKAAEIRSENDAFKKIRPALEKIGWRYVEHFTTYFEYGGSLKIVIAPALKLENKGTVITLIPDGTGIEISKENIPGCQIFYFRFLNNLLYFLTQNGISEIYRHLFNDEDLDRRKDRASYQKEYLKNLKRRGFTPQTDSNSAYLDVKCFLEQYDQTKIDYTLLSNSFLKSTSEIVSKSVEVTFEFLYNKEKDFIVVYHFEDYEAIRKRIIDLIKELPKDESCNLILKTLFAPAFEAESEITNEERELIQQAFGDILERAADSVNYRHSVRLIGLVIIGTYHYQMRGIENGINGYQLTLDQNSHSLQIKPFKTT
jgi:DNA-binding Lrp family transcriptional regulator